MLRREFLKLLGFGLPALVLVKPEFKEEKPKPELMKEASVPSVWTGTNGTANSASITTWPVDSKTVYIYNNEEIDWSKVTWSVYQGDTLSWDMIHDG